MSEVNISLTVTNPILIAGIEFARDLYNASLPEVQAVDGEGVPQVNEDGSPVYVTPKPGIMTSDEYVTFVGREAVKSYARQKIENDFAHLGIITKQQRDNAIAALG